jgi:hypothetical protein
MGIAADKEAKVIATHAETLKEMGRLATGGNLERLRLGQLYYELTLRNDISYEAIDAHLVTTYGVQMPARSSMSRLRKVYEVWHAQGAVPLSELAFFSPYLLYQVQLRTVITARTAPMWMQRMRTYTREQVLEAAAGMAGAKPKGEHADFVQFALQKEIAALFNDARVRFAESVGEEKVSPTAFIEFISQLVLDSSTSSLRVLWAKLHGEEVEHE